MPGKGKICRAISYRVRKCINSKYRNFFQTLQAERAVILKKELRTLQILHSSTNDLQYKPHSHIRDLAVCTADMFATVQHLH